MPNNLACDITGGGAPECWCIERVVKSGADTGVVTDTVTGAMVKWNKFLHIIRANKF